MGGFKGKGKGFGSGRKPRGGRGGPHPWINTQIIQASENKDVHHLMKVIMEHLPQMNLVNLSTAIHRVAKIVGTDPRQQGQLRQQANLETLLNSVCTALNVVEATEVQPQSVSNVVWSLATLRIVHRPLLQVISLVVVSNVAQFKSFELSTTLWALAKLGSLEDAAPVDKAVFYAAATHIHNNVHDFGFRCLATTAWAFATAKQRHARLFRSMAAAMLPAAAGANCQEMANTAWAFGTADFHDDALFHELAEQAVHHLDEFKPQEISNMLWGFATNSFFHEGFYARAAQVAQKLDLQSQHLANILWAFARVRPKHPLTQQAVMALLPVCTLQLSTFKPQEVSSTLLATAKAVGHGEDVPPPPTLENFSQEVLDFFHACLPWVVARLREFSEQSLANSISAYAMVPVRGSETLVECAGREVLQRMKDLDVNALVHILKGFMMVSSSVSSMKIIKAVATSISKQLDKVRAQEMQSLGRLLNRGAQMRELSKEEVRQRLHAISDTVHFSDGLGEVQRPMAQQTQMSNLDMTSPQTAEQMLAQKTAQQMMNSQQVNQMNGQQMQMNGQGMQTNGQQMQMNGQQMQMNGRQLQMNGQQVNLQRVNVQQMNAQQMSPQQMASSQTTAEQMLAQQMSAQQMNAATPQMVSQMAQMTPEMLAQTIAAAQQMSTQQMTPTMQAPLAPLAPLVLDLQAQVNLGNGLDAQGHANGMEGMFPEARRQQLSQVRKARGQKIGMEDDSHNRPLCPISESRAVMDMQKLVEQKMAGTMPAGPQSFGEVAGTPAHMGSMQNQVFQPFPGVAFPGAYHDLLMPNAASLAPEALHQDAKGGAGGAVSSGTNWESNHKLFVKNSFLHVEDSDEESDDGNCDGTSSHRSSSMPSRMSRDNEERWSRLPHADMLELLYAMRNKTQNAGSSRAPSEMASFAGTGPS